MAVKTNVWAQSNNEFRNSGVVRGKFAFADFSGLVSGTDSVAIVSVPFKSLITNVYIQVDTAFDGTATVDVGVAGDTDKYVNDLDVTSAGLTKCTTGIDRLVGADNERVLISPTFDANVTKGNLRVIVEFLDIETVSGAYVEDGK